MTAWLARTSAENQDYPIYDEEQALALLTGDRELLRLLVRLFLEFTPPLLRELRSSYGNGDVEKMSHLAHRLEVSANQICVMRMAAGARALGSMMTLRDAASAYQHIEQLTADFDDLRQALKGA